MAQSVVLRGADIKIYIGGKLFKGATSVNYTIDYHETEIYGINSSFPQEIAPTRVSVAGSVQGIRVKLSGGLQGNGLRSKINEILHSPYVSLQIKDRHSNDVLLWLPQMKVSSEQFSAQIKGVVRVSFSFKGIIPYNTLDIA